MARFIQDVVLNKPDNFVYFIMNDYLQKNGFVTSQWKGETAYRTGDGIIESCKYLNWTYTNGTLHLEAWMKGTFGGEWDLDGFVGCAFKKPYKNDLMQLISILQQPLPENAEAMQGDSAAMGENAAQQATPNPIPVQTVDNYSAAQQGLIFGILALVFCFSPILCVVFACIGFSRCKVGKNSSKANLAKIGNICCIVGLCIMAVLFILNFVLNILLVLI